MYICAAMPYDISQVQFIFDNLKDYPKPKYLKVWEEIYENMTVHTRGSSEEAAKRVLVRHLTEDEACFKWRIDNFVCVTNEPYMRFLSNTARIIKDSGYTIKASENVTSFINGNNFPMDAEQASMGDFMQFVFNVWQNITYEDPNGYIAWLAYSTDETQLPIIEAEKIESEHIRYVDRDIFIFESEKREGTWFALTTDAIYWAVQDEKSAKWKVELQYFHNFGFIPVIKNGGFSCDGDYFKSFLHGFQQIAHECLRDYSDYVVVKSKTNFPVVEVLQDECEHCTGGYVDNKTCTHCGGTGYARPNPFTMFVRPAINKATDDTSDAPAMRYIEAPVNSINSSREAFNHSFDMVERSLYLKLIDASQSGVAKSIDREEQYTLLSYISANMFNNQIFNSLIIFERYFNSTETPSVIAPQDFDLKTVEEIQLDVETSQKIGNNFAALLALDNLIDRKYSGNELAQKKHDFLKQYDLLYANSDMQKLQLKTAGVVTSIDWFKSVAAPTALEKIDANTIMNGTYEQIATLVDAQLTLMNPQLYATPNELQ